MTNAQETVAVVRVRDFVERYATWLKEVSAAARTDAAVAASLADLMKDRLACDLENFVELEVRLRVFERRTADQSPMFKLVGNGG